jgi:hypothetical protein
MQATFENQDLPLAGFLEQNSDVFFVLQLRILITSCLLVPLLTLFGSWLVRYWDGRESPGPGPDEQLDS